MKLKHITNMKSDIRKVAILLFAGFYMTRSMIDIPVERRVTLPLYQRKQQNKNDDNGIEEIDELKIATELSTSLFSSNQNSLYESFFENTEFDAVPKPFSF